MFFKLAQVRLRDVLSDYTVTEVALVNEGSIFLEYRASGDYDQGSEGVVYLGVWSAQVHPGFLYSVKSVFVNQYYDSNELGDVMRRACKLVQMLQAAEDWSPSLAQSFWFASKNEAYTVMPYFNGPLFKNVLNLSQSHLYESVEQKYEQSASTLFNWMSWSLELRWSLMLGLINQLLRLHTLGYFLIDGSLQNIMLHLDQATKVLSLRWIDFTRVVSRDMSLRHIWRHCKGGYTRYCMPRQYHVLLQHLSFHSNLEVEASLMTDNDDLDMEQRPERYAYHLRNIVLSIARRVDLAMLSTIIALAFPDIFKLQLMRGDRSSNRPLNNLQRAYWQVQGVIPNIEESSTVKNIISSVRCFRGGFERFKGLPLSYKKIKTPEYLAECCAPEEEQNKIALRICRVWIGQDILSIRRYLKGRLSDWRRANKVAHNKFRLFRVMHHFVFAIPQGLEFNSVFCHSLLTTLQGMLVELCLMAQHRRGVCEPKSWLRLPALATRLKTDALRSVLVESFEALRTQRPVKVNRGFLGKDNQVYRGSKGFFSRVQSVLSEEGRTGFDSITEQLATDRWDVLQRDCCSSRGVKSPSL